MTPEAISHAQAGQAGIPTKGRKTSATTPEPSEISVVVESGSSPTLISAFQPAWQSAANSTARKTKFSKIHPVILRWREAPSKDERPPAPFEARSARAPGGRGATPP